MDISKFDFTKFSKEKWQKIIDKLAEGDVVVNTKVSSVDNNGNPNPTVTVQCAFETVFGGIDKYLLIFSCFDVTSNVLSSEECTVLWRRIMIKEFGDVYYNSLVYHLELIKEQKKQKADEEYENDLRVIHQSLYFD